MPFVRQTAIVGADGHGRRLHAARRVGGARRSRGRSGTTSRSRSARARSRPTRCRGCAGTRSSSSRRGTRGSFPATCSPSRWRRSSAPARAGRRRRGRASSRSGCCGSGGGPVTRVAVVGAGIMGCATAWALAARGAEVTLVEQFEPGHDRGSSHGRSRIVRLSYPDPEWVRLAAEARAGWAELEAETGRTLLELHGLVELAASRRADLGAALSRRTASSTGGSRPAEARALGVALPDGWAALHEPSGGIVRADQARAAFLDAALARGVRLETGRRVVSLDELDADAVVVTAGRLGAALRARPARPGHARDHRLLPARGAAAAVDHRARRGRGRARDVRAPRSGARAQGGRPPRRGRGRPRRGGRPG